MKHKSLLSIFIIVLVLTLTSCIDYVQSITYSNGKYHLYHKITLSKILFEMTGEDAEYSVDEFLDTSSHELPDYITLKGVNTETEAGFEFILDVDPKTASEEEKQFLPTMSGDKYFIPLHISESMSDSDDFDDVDLADSVTLLMISTAKLRVMIAKNIMPSIQNAYFEAEDGENFYISVFDYGNNYCLEIPFLLFFENYLYDLNRIIITRGK